MSSNTKLRNIGRIDKVTYEEEHSDAKKGLLLSPDKKEIISNDPFILFAEDWFRLPNGGFPSHPHAGFQTMTFVRDGTCQHKDSTGAGGILKQGDIQVMIAGRGVIHSELATSRTEFTHTLQLWVNIPKKYKKVAPSYQDITANNIPIYQDKENDTEVKIIAGEYKGTKGAGAINYIELEMVQVNMKTKGKQFSIDLPDNKAGFIYLISGQIKINNSTTVQSPAVIKLPSIDDKSETKYELLIESLDSAVEFLLGVGKRINEPVIQYGPFVANSPDEIQQIFIDYQSGKFNQKLSA